jgi:hypothetical protein
MISLFHAQRVPQEGTEASQQVMLPEQSLQVTEAFQALGASSC